jgi:membrane protein
MMGRRLPFRQVGSVAYQAIAGWVEHNDSNMGAALAFYTMFAIAPILIIAVAVAGYVFGPHVAETQVLQQLSALLGDTGANAIRDLLLSAHYSDQRGFAAVVGITTLLVGATSVFGELQYTLDRIWNTPPERAVVWWQIVRKRVLSIGLVLGVGFLLMVYYCCGFTIRRRYFYLARNSHVWLPIYMVRAARPLASDAFLHGTTLFFPLHS